MKFHYLKNLSCLNYFSLIALLFTYLMYLSPTSNAGDLLQTFQFNGQSVFESAENCRTCHVDQYEQWRSSLMGYSSISPPIHALELTENHTFRDPDGDGVGFGRLAKTFPNLPNGSAHPSYVSGQENQLFCQKCHAPVAVFADLFSNIQQFDFGNVSRNSTPDSHSLLRQIAGVDTPTNVTGTITSVEQNNAMTAMEGVTCTVCHRMNGMTTSNNSRPGFQDGIANSGYLIQHFGTQEAPINYGPIDPNSIPANMQEHGVGWTLDNTTGGSQLFVGADGMERPYIQTGEFCGACHDVRIPFPDANIAGSQFRRVENLFTEWQQSAWNNFNLKPNEMAGQPAVIDNPRELVLDSNNDPVLAANGEPVKKITTCQDCHMSTYMTDPKAKPGDHEDGFIALQSTVKRRKTNHRFIGVDRFLIHDIPGGSTTDELEDFDISQIESPVDDSFSDIDLSSLEFNNGKADAREILLQKAVDFKIQSAELTVQNGSNILPIEIYVENVGAGHNIPAGLSQERQVWIELQVLDRLGDNVFTSGYLSPIEPVAEIAQNPSPDPDLELFNPTGTKTYKESYCGKNDGEHEYECDLDSFRAKLNNDLTIKVENGVRQLFPGDDTVLRNYQNGFTRKSEGDRKVFSQFIGDSIDNGNSLAPFDPKIESYMVNVDGHEGPFIVKARLRFRPFPHEFLAALKQKSSSFSTSRVTDEVIARNKVIEMANDACTIGTIGTTDPESGGSVRPCSESTKTASGADFACAISTTSANHTVECWGTGKDGRLGNGQDVNIAFPPSEVHGLTNVKMVATGESHACALKFDGTVSCWGDGDKGATGDGNTSAHSVLTPHNISSSLVSNAVYITVYDLSTCVVLESGLVKCWGDADNNRLADGNFSDHAIAVPTLVETSWLNNVKKLGLGYSHGCALINDGTVKCWGENTNGQLGNGTNTNSNFPINVKSLHYKVKELQVGFGHSCAVLANREVKCWGFNGAGQLGLGFSSGSENLPQSVLLGEDDPLSISTGTLQTCVSFDNQERSVSCWGGSPWNTDVPTPVISASAENIGSATGWFACGATNEATLCWGKNTSGVLGVEGVSNTFVGVQSPTLSIFDEDAEDENLSSNLINTGSEGWTRFGESTPSGGTGPSSGSNSTHFYYMETSSGHAYNAGDTAIFETPYLNALELDLFDTPLSFDYHMYGNNIGSLSVEFYSTITKQWANISTTNGNQGNQWNTKVVALGGVGYFGQIKFRIIATAAGGYQGDIAIDNIRLGGNKLLQVLK